MSEQPLYQGTNETAILEVLDAVLEQAFGDLLSEKPVHELVPAELKLEEIVDIGDGYKSSGRSPMFAMISVASTLHARSKKGKGVWTSWVLSTVCLHDHPSEIKILFQGGFVKDNTFAFNATSMGLVHDIMVPRGFVSTLQQAKPAFERASIHTDTDDSAAPSPFISIYETQSRYDSSKMNQLLKKIPSYSMFEASGRLSGTTYEASLSPMLIMSPRHGKTIISLRFNLYSGQGKSKCATFMMPGDPKPWKLEVAFPAPENFKHGYEVLKEAIDIPVHLATNEEVTGEIGGGVDTYLALEIARQKFRPDSTTFTLEDIVRSNTVVAEVVNELKTNYPRIEIDVANQLKGEVLRKT